MTILVQLQNLVVGCLDLGTWVNLLLGYNIVRQGAYRHLSSLIVGSKGAGGTVYNALAQKFVGCAGGYTVRVVGRFG